MNTKHQKIVGKQQKSQGQTTHPSQIHRSRESDPEMFLNKPKTSIRYFLIPFQIYVFYLLFKQPVGWLLINLIVPIKAIQEYSQIHMHIMKYVLHEREPDPKKSQHHLLFDQLMAKLNSTFISTAMLITFHLSLLLLQSTKVILYLVILYVLIFIIKMGLFHNFMMNQSPGLAKIVALNEFQQEALVISCISLLMEVFGHVFISLLSGMGYFIYVMNPKYVLFVIAICAIFEAVRLATSALVSKRPVAKYIAPKMYLDGVFISMAAT